MQVLAPESCRPPSGGTAVTIGAYDGVHLGHRALFDLLGERARSGGLSTAVVTFDRHPATVVRPDSAPLALCDLPQKLELLATCGVERTLVVPFDEERSGESAEEFVDEVLVGLLGARLVVVGSDFHFGHRRRGNVDLLTHMGVASGFEVEGIDLVGGQPPVSSTRIRSLVADGDVDGAALLLGRPHEVRGTVIAGDARGGAALGVPTANVDVPRGIALPGVGIYAGTYVERDGAEHLAAISVGRRPTFYPDGTPEPLLEVHLLDFDGDLYGEPARVRFESRLRDERRFEDVGELIEQMHRDIADVRGRAEATRSGGVPPKSS